MVPARGSYPPSVGAESHVNHRAIVIIMGKVAPVAHGKHPGHAVLAAGNNPGSIRAESHGIHHPMVHHVCDFLACLYLKNMRRACSIHVAGGCSAGSQELAVRTEGKV